MTYYLTIGWGMAVFTLALLCNNKDLEPKALPVLLVCIVFAWPLVILGYAFAAWQTYGLESEEDK